MRSGPTLFLLAALGFFMFRTADGQGAAPPSAAQQLDRQDAAARRMQEITRPLILDLEQEIATLRPRMKAALAGKHFADTNAGAPNRIRFTLDGHDCMEILAEAKPCVQCETLAADAFDTWFDRAVLNFNNAKSILVMAAADWAAERQKYREEIGEAGLSRTMDPNLFEREAQVYLENHWVVTWMANLVWAMHSAEIGGLYRVEMPGMDGSFRPDNSYARGPGEFPGIFGRLTLETSLAAFATQRTAMEHACKAEIAFDDYGALIGTARNEAAERNTRERAALEGALRECLVVEDAQRDATALQFRVLRQRIFATRARIRGKLETWRKDLIAAHVYPGEGEAAIAAAQGDEQHFRLDGSYVLMFNLAYSYGKGGLPVIDARLNTDISTAASDMEKECHRAAGAERKIKYPDIEQEPYSFSLAIDMARVERRSVLAVAPGDRP